MNHNVRVMVVGLGNDLLRDDRVGLLVARRLQGQFADDEVRICESERSGFAVAELFEGCETGILIDALVTELACPGRLHRSILTDAGYHRAYHDLSVPTALTLLRRLGRSGPKQVIVHAVEVADAFSFGEALTPGVAAAVPRLVARVVWEVRRLLLAHLAGDPPGKWARRRPAPTGPVRNVAPSNDRWRAGMPSGPGNHKPAGEWS